MRARRNSLYARIGVAAPQSKHIAQVVGTNRACPCMTFSKTAQMVSERHSWLV